MRRRNYSTTVMATVIFFSLFGALLAQPIAPSKASPGATTKPSSGPESIVQEHPGFFVHADVDHSTRRYEEGDSLVVRVTSEADAYVHVVYRQADGKVYQIFPNSGQRDNRIKARQTLQFPASDGLFRWIVGPPFGKELIKVIATKQPLGRLSEAQLRQLRFNPVSGNDIESTRSELAKKEGWTEDQVEITTFARGQTAAPVGGRRFAVFSGVGKYEFNDVVKELRKENLKKDKRWKEGDPEPRGLDLGASPPNNVKLMEALFRQYGQLTETQRRVDEQATRQGLKESVEWLKEVSRPGDTVFIYHAGHGGRSPGNPQSDSNLPPGVKPVYFLLPHDFADGNVLVGLLKRKTAGSLAPSLEPRFRKMLTTAFPDGKVPQGEQEGIAAERRLLAEFAVTAEDFGHWIQMLDGRQVVVILEVCHSGGFATRETEEGKGIGEDKAIQEFNFLGPELGRLKDIGQPESALLAVCSGRESTVGGIITDEDLQRMIDTQTKPTRFLQLGLACYLLSGGIEKLPAPLELDKRFESWFQQRMERYCQLHNKALPPEPGTGDKPLALHPRLFNYCSKPIIVKP